MFRAKNLIAASVLLIGAAINSTDASTSTDLDCTGNVSILGYSQVIVSKDNQIKFKITADKACASRFGRPYDLKDVTLSIEFNEKTLMHVQAENGTTSPAQNKILLGKIRSSEVALKSPKTATPLAILIDTNEMTVRSPSGLYIDFEKNFRGL